MCLGVCLLVVVLVVVVVVVVVVPAFSMLKVYNKTPPTPPTASTWVEECLVWRATGPEMDKSRGTNGQVMWRRTWWVVGGAVASPACLGNCTRERLRSSWRSTWTRPSGDVATERGWQGGQL